jgi:hypothetical protein
VREGGRCKDFAVCMKPESVVQDPCLRPVVCLVGGSFAVCGVAVRAAGGIEGAGGCVGKVLGLEVCAADVRDGVYAGRSMDSNLAS